MAEDDSTDSGPWTPWEEPKEHGVIVNYHQWTDWTKDGGVDLVIENVKSYKNQSEDDGFKALKECILQELCETKQRCLDVQHENLQGGLRNAVITLDGTGGAVARGEEEGNGIAVAAVGDQASVEK